MARGTTSARRHCVAHCQDVTVITLPPPGAETLAMPLAGFRTRTP